MPQAKGSGTATIARSHSAWGRDVLERVLKIFRAVYFQTMLLAISQLFPQRIELSLALRNELAHLADLVPKEREGGMG